MIIVEDDGSKHLHPEKLFLPLFWSYCRESGNSEQCSWVVLLEFGGVNSHQKRGPNILRKLEKIVTYCPVINSNVFIFSCSVVLIA